MNAIPALVSAAASAAKPVIVELKQQAKRSRSQPKAGKKKRSTGGRRGKSAARGRSRRGARAVAGPSAFGSAVVDQKQIVSFRKICEDTIGRLGADGSGVVSKQTSVNGRNTLSFLHAHLAQRDTDRQFKNGIRVVASSIDGGTVSGTPYLTIRGGNSTQSTVWQALSAGLTNQNLSDLPLTPARLSNSLEVLEECFERYAVRYVRLRGRPRVGDFSGNNAPAVAPIANPDVELAIGIRKDPQGATIDGASFTEVAQLETSTVSRVTKSWELEYAHTGTETFTTDNIVAEDAENSFQAMIAAAFDGNATLGADPTHVGPTVQHTEVFAIVDFYGLRAPQTNVELKAGPYRHGFFESEVAFLEKCGHCINCTLCSPDAKEDPSYILTGSEARELERLRKKAKLPYGSLCTCTRARSDEKVARKSVTFASAIGSLGNVASAASAQRASTTK